MTSRGADSIHLLTGSRDEPSCSTVGLLFESAEDSAARTLHPESPGLLELIGEPRLAKEEAYRIARLLLEDEPLLRGVPQVSVFEELVIGELQAIVHASHLVDWLVANGLRTCSFTRSTKLLEFAKCISEERNVSVRFDASACYPPEPSTASALNRSWGRLTSARFDRVALEAEVHQALSRVDRFQRRARILPSRRFEPGRVWFYTTAYTYTLAGLAMEPFSPDGFLYLVDSPLTGGVPLSAGGRTFWSPYQFGRREHEPAANEVREGMRQLEAHIAGISLSPELDAIRTVLMNGPFFRSFRKRLFPVGLFMSGLADSFLEEARPRAIVVGNPAFEGYLLHRARHAGIPTALVQHGILGDYCQLLNPPVDHYLVRGPFWREFLSPRARQRSRILNPHRHPSRSTPPRKKAGRLVFLTAPYREDSPWDEGEVDEILRVLLGAVRDCGAELVVRVHPQEQVGPYRTRVGRLHEGGDVQGRVLFSQGGAMGEVLGGASAVVTYSSTAFLDCIRRRVPVISFGWHDFAYRSLIERHGVFQLCSGFAELEKLAVMALREGLPPFSGDIELIDEETPDEVLRRDLRQILGAGPTT